MLDIRATISDYHGTTSYSDLIPWMNLVEPGMVLNMDGSLLTTYQFRGVDVEGLMVTDSDRYATLFEQALRTCNENMTLWGTMDRRKSGEYPEDRFESPIGEAINKSWKDLVKGNQYSNKNYLSLSYKPSRGTDGFFDGVNSHLRTGGFSLTEAIKEELKVSLSKKYAVSKMIEKIDSMRAAFSGKLREFEDTMVDLGLKKLETSELLSYLHARCSPATADQPVEMTGELSYLNSWLPDNELTVEHDHLYFDHVKPKYVSAFSIKDWPNGASPGLLDALMSIPCELTVSQCFRFIDQSKAKAYIEDAEAHHRDSTKSIVAKLMEQLTKQQSDQVDTGHLVLASDAQEAMRELTAQKRYFGWYNMTVLVYGDTKVELDYNMQMVSQTLRHRGFVVLPEKINLLSAFTQTFTGQLNTGFRWSFMNIANVSDMAMIRTVGEGKPVCDHLTVQTGRVQHALSIFPTEYATPYNFNLFETDLGHTITIGPAGSGKSSFMNFLISQFGKHAPCNRFIFDKDLSCWIPTLLHGGKHINMDLRVSTKVQMNPFRLISDNANLKWLVSWIKLLVCARGYELKAEDDGILLNALKDLKSQPENLWCLTNYLQYINQKELKAQFAPWEKGGMYGDYFDNENDEFNLSSFVCMEMGGLLDSEVGAPFMDYAFFRINQALDGRPTLIYVEECWFMLANQTFAAKLDDWLRTLRKKNTAVVMATQSLQEIAKSEIFMSIIDNVPNRIFLPNPNAYAHTELYTEKFGLNPTQVSRITNAIPKQQYYLVNARLSRMINAKFSREIMACLASDERSKTMFRRHYADGQGVENWEFNYVRERSNV